MDAKVLLVFLVLIVVFFARESEAYRGHFPPGKRKKIQRKREYEEFNLLNNETVILLNLAEYRLILADEAYVG